MLRALALLAVGCAAAPPSAIKNTASPTRHGVMPTGREATLLRETFAAISAGRLDTLFVLADPLLGGALSCPDALGEKHRQDYRREFFQHAILDAGGKPITLLGITHDRVVEHVAGQATWSCTRLAAQNAHELEVAVNIGGRETVIEIQATDVGGRWFLDLASIMNDTDREALATLRGLAHEMCACADRMCAAHVQFELATWLESVDDLARSGFPPPHFDRLHNTDEVVKYHACLSAW
jgi:hypothetical protein